MPSIKELETKVATLATKALAVVEDDRPWSEKSTEVEKYETDIKAAQDELADHKAVTEHGANLKALTGATETEDGPDAGDGADTKSGGPRAEVKSIGEQVVESDAFKAIPAAGGRFSTGPIDVKATLTTGAGGAGMIVPQYQTDPVSILFKRLTVADLLASGQLDAARNTLIYVKESSVTNAAATVAEGAAKPASDLNTAQVTETLHKIANTLKVSDEMVQDALATLSYVNGRLVLFVELTEEDELLNGSGSGTHVTGLLNRSGKSADVAVGSDTVPTRSTSRSPRSAPRRSSSPTAS
jgi:HK97 family phage major capsid protein